MSDAIIVAIISGVFSLCGVIIGVLQAQKKTENTIRTNQAVTDTKLEELTREVRRHNNFAERMPYVEAQISEIDKRLSKVEQKND